MDVADRALDRQRDRWRCWRKRQAIAADAGPDFATGGLARLVEELELRLVFLPGDPEGEVVSFDKATLEWLGAERPLPFNDRARTRPWPCSRSSVDALVCYQPASRGSQWRRYLAIHRNGCVEFASGSVSYPAYQLKAFALREIVGLWWRAASLQADAVARWRIEGPFEATIALRNANGATVGNFAEGWREPGPGLDSVLCLDDHVLLRIDVDGFDDVERVALDVGDRVEQAFGTVHRRHIARQGEFADRFDPRGVFP